MKIKYTTKPKDQVNIGSQFEIGAITYTRTEKGWKFTGQKDVCNDTPNIDKHYLKGTYKIIK